MTDHTGLLVLVSQVESVCHRRSCIQEVIHPGMAAKASGLGVCYGQSYQMGPC